MPDWLRQAIVSSGGTAQIVMNHNLNGITWIVEQVSSQTAKASSAATTWITLNGNVVAPSAALTPLGASGQAATAAGVPYVYLQASDSLYINVQGAVAGDTLTVRAQYVEVNDPNDPRIKGR